MFLFIADRTVFRCRVCQTVAGREGALSNVGGVVFKSSLKKFDVNDIANEKKQTPLLWAATMGRTEIAYILLEQGAFLDYVDFEGLLSFFLVCFLFLIFLLINVLFCSL